MSDDYYDAVSLQLILDPAIFPTKSGHIYDTQTLENLIVEANNSALVIAQQTGRFIAAKVLCPKTREETSIQALRKAISEGAPAIKRMILQCCDDNPMHPDVIELRERERAKSNEASASSPRM